MLRIQGEALTFDDVLLVPQYSEVLPREVCLKTRLSAAIELNIPILSAAMDTVSEARLSIALAQEGGMGIIHKNMSIRQQAEEVLKVKKHESWVISDPITIGARASIRELLDLKRLHNISGVPVVDDGELAGIVTSRDVRYEKRMDIPVKAVMTPRQRLVTVPEGSSAEQVQGLLHEHRIEKVLVVDEDFRLRGLITVKDMEKARLYPGACKDRQGRLRVGAAVSVGEDTGERAAALTGAGVDLLVLDTAHGHTRNVLRITERLRADHPRTQLLAGNVATAEAARVLVKAGAHAVKVGIGPGSICTTRIVTGVGVPQISAIAEVAAALEGQGVTVVADGGMRFSGDIAKALAAGAHAVMVGSLLAGTEEAPGEMELYRGRSYKSYRGMGSLAAMSAAPGAGDRYLQDGLEGPEKLVPEGIEGRVPYKGALASVVSQLLGGLRSSMGYTGCADIEALRTRTQFVRVSAAGMQESHVHDVSITKEAPNYPTT